MKNSKKIIALALLTSISANALAVANPASKNVSYASQNLDFGISTEKFESRSLTYTLKQDEANKNAALAAIRKIRAEMWDKNVPYTYDENSNPNNTKLRDYLKSKGITSKEAYVNGHKWSNDLEKIAIQRTYEVTMTGLSHTRPDGSYNSDAKLPSKTITYGEILANNSDAYTPEKAFYQWTHGKRSQFGGKSEYELLIESNGVFNNGNGHLHIILDPEYDHFGLSIINTGNMNYAGAEFGYEDGSGNKATGLVGDYTMNFGPASKADKPSKEIDQETRDSLMKAIHDSRIQIDAVHFLFKEAPAKVAKVRPILEKLIEESEELIKEAEELLGIA